LGYHEFQAVQQARIPGSRAPYPAREGQYAAHTFVFSSSGVFGRELPDRWVRRDAIFGQYTRILRRYRRYGVGTFWDRNRLARTVVAVVCNITNRALAGWYDTHARHESVTSPPHPRQSA